MSRKNTRNSTAQQRQRRGSGGLPPAAPAGPAVRCQRGLSGSFGVDEHPAAGDDVEYGGQHQRHYKARRGSAAAAGLPCNHGAKLELQLRRMQLLPALPVYFAPIQPEQHSPTIQHLGALNSFLDESYEVQQRGHKLWLAEQQELHRGAQLSIICPASPAPPPAVTPRAAGGAAPTSNAGDANYMSQQAVVGTPQVPHQHTATRHLPSASLFSPTPLLTDPLEPTQVMSPSNAMQLLSPTAVGLTVEGGSRRRPIMRIDALLSPPRATMLPFSAQRNNTGRRSSTLQSPPPEHGMYGSAGRGSAGGMGCRTVSFQKGFTSHPHQKQHANGIASTPGSVQHSRDNGDRRDENRTPMGHSNGGASDDTNDENEGGIIDKRGGAAPALMVVVGQEGAQGLLQRRKGGYAASHVKVVNGAQLDVLSPLSPAQLLVNHASAARAMPGCMDAGLIDTLTGHAHAEVQLSSDISTNTGSCVVAKKARVR